MKQPKRSEINKTKGSEKEVKEKGKKEREKRKRKKRKEIRGRNEEKGDCVNKAEASFSHHLMNINEDHEEFVL